jgi:glycosyltransferase involved in cell wall biosynthesis
MISPKPPRGAYARPHAMARQLVTLGHQVTLMMVSETDHWHIERYLWDGVQAVVMPHILPHILSGRLHYGWDPWDTLRRLTYLIGDEQEFDLIHCFETRPSVIYPGLFKSHQDHIPLLTDWNDWFGRHGLVEYNRPGWYHKLHLEGIETYYEESFRAQAAGLTVISSALRERALKIGVRAERICHIPGGTFLDWFKPRSTKACRVRMNFPIEIPILGFSSSDSHFDLNIIMESLTILIRRFPSILLLVTGRPRAGVYQLVERFGLQEHVCFVGYVPFDELPWYLGCADLFLLPMADLPYNQGRWPNKMGEYMSLGRPTVANPVGDIVSLFRDHPVGLLAGWEAEDFAEKISTLIQDPSLALRLGETARFVAEAEYDWKILGGKLESFYRFILTQEKPSIYQKERNQEGIYGQS